MSQETSPVSQAVVDLLETKSFYFEQQTLQAAQAQVAAQEALEAGAETIVILGREAEALSNTMHWLDRHRFLGRLAGGRPGLIKPGQSHSYIFGGGGLYTEPMLAAEPEYVHDGGQSDYVSDFYVFKTNWHNFIRDPFLFEMTRRVLTISRCMVGAESGIIKPIEDWSVSLGRDQASGELNEVGFNSTRTDARKNKAQEEIFAHYLKDNPALKDHWNASENSEKPVVAKMPAFMLIDYSKPVDWNADPPDLLVRRPDVEPSVLEQLQHELTRGVGWDYFDDDYLFPLGLMRLARSELVGGQILSKLLK